MVTLIKLFWADLKMLTRNRQSLFWSLAFPLMFTIIFGFFFGGSKTTLGTIALINNSDSEIAKSFETALNDSEIFKVQKETDRNTVVDKIKKSKIVGGIVVPTDFGVIDRYESASLPVQNLNLPPAVLSQIQIQLAQNSPKIPIFKDAKIEVVDDPANAQANATLVSFVDKFVTQANLKSQGTKDIFSYTEVKTSDRTVNYFDFVLAGLIGLALMNSSIIGISVAMSKYREDKILKRIMTTPLKTWKFMVAEVTSRLVVNIVQVGLILALGVYAFKAHLYGNVYILFALAILGALLFQLIGFAAASFAKTADAAQGMATTITIPMMFLAGVFFPIDQLPKWLYSIVQYLPLAPLLRMIRGVALEATSPFSNPANMIIVAAWIVAAFLVSLLKFRLSDE